MLYGPILSYIDGRILSCGGNKNKDCYLYHPLNDSWSVYSTSSFTHDLQPGEIYNKKIYLSDDENPEVFDPATNAWSSWPTPKNTGGEGACLVAWKEFFFLIGGYTDKRGFQTFNHSSNTWEALGSSSVPMDVLLSDCLLLPSDEILVVGSEYAPYVNSAALYNIEANTWKQLPNSTSPRAGGGLVILGTRIFVMGDHFENVVEEFDYDTSTWSPVEAKLITHRDGHQGILPLPAEMFQHLPGGCVGVQ